MGKRALRESHGVTATRQMRAFERRQCAFLDFASHVGI